MAWHDRPHQRDHPAVDAFVADLTPPQRVLVEAVRGLVKKDPGVVEGIAWGVPFWFREGPLCYASPARRHVTLGFPRGQEIDDPWGLLSGTGRSPIRKATLRLDQPFPEEAVREWLAQAFLLDEAGDDADVPGGDATRGAGAAPAEGPAPT